MTLPISDALLITKPENVRYLSGFSGEGMALVINNEKLIVNNFAARGKRVLFTDGRYIERAKSEVKKGWKVVLIDRQFDEVFRAGLADMQIAMLGFEAGHMTVAGLAAWKKKLRGAGVTLVATKGVIEEQRRVKSAAEIETIAQACVITSLVLKKALPSIRRGVTEIAVAEVIRQLAVQHGAEGLAFDTIVAFRGKFSDPSRGAGEAQAEKRRCRAYRHGGESGRLLFGYDADIFHSRADSIRTSRV